MVELTAHQVLQQQKVSIYGVRMIEVRCAAISAVGHDIQQAPADNVFCTKKKAAFTLHVR